jgi:hypothetical protein
MALLKTTQLENGYSAEYYRIIRINNFIDGSAEILLALYKDKEIRDANPSAYVSIKTFNFPIPKSFLINGNAFEYAYSKISESNKLVDEDGNETEQNFFADAILV